MTKSVGRAWPITHVERGIETALVDWRRRVQELYAEVRRAADPAEGHKLWRVGRDALFHEHPQSPLSEDHPMRRTGLPYWPYDPGLRFELPVVPDAAQVVRRVPTGSDGVTTMRRMGRIHLPAPIEETVGVWWIEQYGGGLFVPLRDATSGTATYGGGRYLLDTVKGADLGGRPNALIVDLNFLYHPSCRYSTEWTCPLAAAENTISASILAGEQL